MKYSSCWTMVIYKYYENFSKRQKDRNRLKKIDR